MTGVGLPVSSSGHCPMDSRYVMEQNNEHPSYVAVCTCDWSVDSEHWKWIETATQCSNIIALLVSRNLRLLPRAWGPGVRRRNVLPSDQYQAHVFLYRHLHVAISGTLKQWRDEQRGNIPKDVSTSSPATQLSVREESTKCQCSFVPDFITIFFRFSQIYTETNCVNSEQLTRRFWCNLAHKPKLNLIKYSWTDRCILLHYQDSDITQSSEPCYICNVLYTFVAWTGTTLTF